jgi:cell filamentation protein
MDAQTPYTHGPEDNLLGLTRREEVDLEEAKGFFVAENSLGKLLLNEPYSNARLMELHSVALGKLYSWAGKYRRHDLVVGSHTPPEWNKVPNLMAQFQYEVNQFVESNISSDEKWLLLAKTHHRLVWIHPFVNGNGRIARLLNNWLAVKFGYFLGKEPILSIRSEQQSYISALREADNGNYVPIQQIIFLQLDDSPRQSDFE